MNELLDQLPTLIQQNPLTALAFLFGGIFLIFGVALHRITKDPR